MNILNLTDANVFINKGHLSSKTEANEKLLADASLIHNNKILPNFHSPFFYNHDRTSKNLRLRGVPAGTIVSVISVVPTVNATEADYHFCTKINDHNYPKEIFTKEDTKKT